MVKRFRWGKRRTLSTSVTVIALLGLAFGVTQGIAGSGDGQTAPVQYHNSNCGVDTGKRFIGTAKFTLSSGGTLTVKVKLSGADPGRYYLDLYDGECTFLENIGKFKVDAGGSGSKVSATCCYSSGEFFVDARNADTGDDNDSLIVNV
jgi:hypothetical protein